MERKGGGRSTGRTTRVAAAAMILILAAAFPSSAAVSPVPGPDSDRPGLTERTGSRIPGNIVATDDAGRPVRLAALIDRPTLLALVYYRCEHVCPQVLGALGQLVSDLPLAAGRDYRLVTVSFDPADDSGAAAGAKRNYIKPLGPGFPAEAWSFLTASPENIRALTEALGFRVAEDTHGFVHPSVVFVLGRDGLVSSAIRVTRTAYGVGYPIVFQPQAVAAAFVRAGEGLTGPPSPAALLFCYPHEPEGQPRFTAMMTTLGVVTLAGLAVLFLVLAGRGRPRSSPHA